MRLLIFILPPTTTCPVTTLYNKASRRSLRSRQPIIFSPKIILLNFHAVLLKRTTHTLTHLLPNDKSDITREIKQNDIKGIFFTEKYQQNKHFQPSARKILKSKTKTSEPQNVILELEKSDRYCYLLTTKGKKAESLYKSPEFFQMTIKSFFKTI